MIYVDQPITYHHLTLRYKTFSHMWSDTSIEELHVMADRIGLRREWFQLKVVEPAFDAYRLWRAHYDVTPHKRRLAIQLGAMEMELIDYYRDHPVPKWTSQNFSSRKE